MYFISILAIILVTVLAGGNSLNFHLEYFWDTPSLLIILLLCISILLSAGLFKDFNNAFRIALSKKKDKNLIEIKRGIEAINLAVRTLLCSGFFFFILSLFVILRSLDDLSMLGPHIAVAVLTCIYTLAITIILLPIKSILKVKVIEFMPEYMEKEELKEELIKEAEPKKTETE